jgi:hypothetical protein
MQLTCTDTYNIHKGQPDRTYLDPRRAWDRLLSPDPRDDAFREMVARRLEDRPHFRDACALAEEISRARATQRKRDAKAQDKVA